MVDVITVDKNGDLNAVHLKKKDETLFYKSCHYRKKGEGFICKKCSLCGF